MKNKKIKIIIGLIIIVLLILGIILAYKMIFSNKESEEMQSSETEEELLENQIEEQDETMVVDITNNKKNVEIYNGEDRPIAVMIDNHNGAWPQAGLNEAYLVYEIVVEGGETRLMALFKGKTVEKIGPVRSSRHYFLDYAMENNAIYVHYGWSPQAESDISTYKINNINGISYSSSNFWRVKDKNSPHNVLTSTDAILSIAENRGYELKSTEESVLNYVTEAVNLENGTEAKTITIPHSNLQTVKYTYDEQTGRYTRYARNKLQTDYITQEAFTTKNIIIEYVDNYTLNDSENKGRQGLYNIGTFNGYYITNGKAIQIKCTKSSREAKTVYKDLNGNVIEVNDGNTWIHLVPSSEQVSMS